MAPLFTPRASLRSTRPTSRRRLPRNGLWNKGSERRANNRWISRRKDERAGSRRQVQLWPNYPNYGHKFDLIWPQIWLNLVTLSLTEGATSAADRVGVAKLRTLLVSTAKESAFRKVIQVRSKRSTCMYWKSFLSSIFAIFFSCLGHNGARPSTRPHSRTESYHDAQAQSQTSGCERQQRSRCWWPNSRSRG